MIAALLAFAAAALGTAGIGLLLPDRRERRARPRLLALVVRGGTARHPPRDLERRIEAAGRPGGLGAKELMAAKVTAAIAAGVAGAPVGAVAPGRVGPLLMATAPVAGFLAPDAWLMRRAAERARAARRELPAMLDLLRVTVDAGASLPAALAAVGARASGPLADEWAAVGREVALGVPLSEALDGLARRLPQAEVQALCGALDRARRHGAPLGRTLSAQARDARVALRRRVQEDAAKAGPKIQLVVALLLVPSVLLMVAAALASALLESGGLPS